MMILFLLFFIIAGMALMNAIVGVVVECTLTASKANAELSNKDREKVDKLVMDSLRQIFKDADTDGSGELDKTELHAALCTHRVRDRLKFLSIPFKDLMMLFELLDESGSGNINTDMFFRGVSRLRGQAAASDLHQMSVDLRNNLDWCDDHLGQVETVNDCLGSLVDMIDDFDSVIVRSESDGKDPVLMQRRTRPKVSKGEALRGRPSYFMLGANAPKGSKNVWLEFDEMQISDDRSGGNQSTSQKGSKGMQGSKASDYSQESPPKKKVVVKASKKSQKTLENPNQPAPPPLPLHLQRLNDQRKTKGPKRGRGKKDEKPTKGRNQFEF
jgi:Ca2+-binding EF-hand superfamily protein